MKDLDTKMIAGIFILFSGFYVLFQVQDSSRILGLAIIGVGLYFILSNIK